MRTPAVFLDRDGTVTREVGYVDDFDRLELEAGAAEALRDLQAQGLKLVIVTNQTGPARGLHAYELIDAAHDKLRALLEAEGVALDGIYVCPHHPDVGEPPLRQACECRKPKPGLLLQAARELNIDLARSYMVGDKASDVRCAQAVGATALLVLTGHGRDERVVLDQDAGAPPAAVCDNLREAARWILRDLGAARTATRG